MRRATGQAERGLRRFDVDPLVVEAGGGVGRLRCIPQSPPAKPHTPTSRDLVPGDSVAGDRPGRTPRNDDDIDRETGVDHAGDAVRLRAPQRRGGVGQHGVGPLRRAIRSAARRGVRQRDRHDRGGEADRTTAGVDRQR